MSDFLMFIWLMGILKNHTLDITRKTKLNKQHAWKEQTNIVNMNKYVI